MAGEFREVWRAKAYSFDPTPDYGEWTGSLDVLESDVDSFVERCYDWIYVERRTRAGDAVDVAFDGGSPHLPNFREWIKEARRMR